MAFCTKCGAKLEDGATFCTSCGTKVEAASTNTTNSSDFSKKAQSAVDNISAQIKNVKDCSADFTAEDKEQNKIFAILAYLGILFLVPLLAAPNSAFAKFHANQGLVLFIAEIIIGVITAIPLIGWIVGPILSVVAFIFAILGIIDAATGKAKELPFIGKYRILK